MRRFKTKSFHRNARREGISDESLADAVERLERGLIDADLGGGLFKQRVARLEEGKSSGFRTLICFRLGERAFFVYVFAKSRMDNITQRQEKDLKKLASALLNMPEEKIAELLNDGSLIEF